LVVFVGEQPSREPIALGCTHTEVAGVRTIGHADVVDAEIASRFKHAGGKAGTEHAGGTVCCRDVGRKGRFSGTIQRAVKQHFTFSAEAARRVVEGIAVVIVKRGSYRRYHRFDPSFEPLYFRAE